MVLGAKIWRHSLIQTTIGYYHAELAERFAALESLRVLVVSAGCAQGDPKASADSRGPRGGDGGNVRHNIAVIRRLDASGALLHAAAAGLRDNLSNQTDLDLMDPACGRDISWANSFLVFSM